MRPFATAMAGVFGRRKFMIHAAVKALVPIRISVMRDSIPGTALKSTRPVKAFTRWDEKAGLRGMRYAPNV